MVPRMQSELAQPENPVQVESSDPRQSDSAEQSCEECQESNVRIANTELLSGSSMSLLYGNVMENISSGHRLIPIVDIKTAEKCGSLNKLKSIPSMSLLIETFKKTSLEALLGFSAATGEISLTIQVKVVRIVFRIQLAFSVKITLCFFFFAFNSA